MSNRPRHRHVHTMSDEQRARRKVQHGLVPVVPGVIYDREQATIDEAMRQAHEVLQYIPGTQVCLRLYDTGLGLEIVKEAFGDKAVVVISNMLFMARVKGGANPTVTFATREPHEHDGEECGHG